ncbi:MAG TPA: family 78 glycoside hydrolase catalytic domain, partial [Fimbriimonadaceae bacterium]|nr:family 78 glycoside hydrolase catalytic domain [Fimbriimonadaceae bacterium]
VWDEQDGQTTSGWSFFEMGLLRPQDWTAHWIGADFYGGPRTTSPAPHLRREFELRPGLVRARIYVTALGLYELSVNGQPAGEQVFAPGWTDYGKRVQVQTLDVTDLLQEGPNALGVILGDGWYCGHVAWRDRQVYGERPKLLMQVHLDFEDGSREVLVSDGAWKFASGPILESDMLMGEAYDARRELPGWDRPGYDELGWRQVQVFEPPSIRLDPMLGPPVRRILEIRPPEDPKPVGGWPTSRWLVDLGQNMVGRVRLRVKGAAGTTVRLRFAEMLKDGALYTKALRGARVTDYYTLKGDPGGEEYEPHFTFHGFRYVEVSGVSEKLDRESITGIVLHSDTPVTGEFECSDELVNQLQRNIQWGQRGNFLEVPTDCPQRDERLGWTGDAQVFVRTACFNMDVAGFFHKWQRDIDDSQSSEGSVPPVVPNPGLGPDGGPAWADAAIICPWTIYECYGDPAILQRHYESFKAFVGYLETEVSKDYIRSYPGMEGFLGYGDWLSTKADTPID